MKKIFILISGLLGIVAWATSATAAPAVDEIINQANLAAYYGGNDGRAEVTMTITDAQGRVRMREFVILRTEILRLFQKAQRCPQNGVYGPQTY